MRNLMLILLINLCMGATVSAQVKIGDNPQNIDPSSVLELESTDKVLVITRVTTAQMNAIVPSQGALCFNTDLQSVHYYDGTQWVDIGGGGTGGPLTADPIVNTQPTIVITPTATGDNLEVAPNSIRSEQIVDGGINGVDIQDGSIGQGKLQDNSVTQEKLSENSVGAFALDNDNIGVSAFNNDVGYITAGDITSISADAGNAITAGSDGGAFYDDTNLLMDVMDNAADIAADNDQSPANEIQNPTLTGTILGLTNTAGTVDLGPLISAGGSDDQNIGPVSLDASNILSIGIEDGNPATVDLSALAGGGGTDDQTAAEVSYDPAISGLTATNTQAAIDEIVAGGLVNEQSITVETTQNEIQLLDNDGTTVGSVVKLDGLTIDAINNGVDDVIRLADAAVTENKLAPMGATADGDRLQWDTTLNAGAGGWEVVPGGTGAGEANMATNGGTGGVGIVLPKNGVNLPFKSINVGASGILGVTDDTAENEIEIDIVPATALPTPADQMLITTDAGVVEWAPLASHTGTAKSIFFADTDGTPTTADENVNPDDDRGFFWDTDARQLGAQSFGALFIGLEPGNAQSNAAKVHIADNFPGVAYALQLQNNSATVTGRTTGMLFATEGTGSYGKGALVYEYQDTWARGDFHFLQRSDFGPGTDDNPDLSHRAFTIKNNSDIVLYGGIDIDGVGTGTNGQVLTSTGAGVAWGAAGGTATLNDGNIFVGNASNQATSVTMTGDAQIDNAGSLTIQANAVENGMLDKANIPLSGFGAATADISMGNFKITDLVDPTADQEAATKKYVDDNAGGIGTLNQNNIILGDATNTPQKVALSTVAISSLSAAIADVSMGGFQIRNVLNPTTDQDAATKKYVDDNAGANLFSQDLTLANQRTHDLGGNNLILGGSGDVAIGTLPGAPISKLDVNGQISARNGFASATGTAGNPAYGFHTGGDTDMGMFRAGVDQLAFSTNSNEALRIDANQNVGVGTTSPTSTLHTGGSFATSIDRVPTAATLDQTRHTIILTGNAALTLPAADNTNMGRIFIIKNTSYTPSIIGTGYVDLDGTAGVTTIPLNTTITIQSDGIDWQRIN